MKEVTQRASAHVTFGSNIDDLVILGGFDLVAHSIDFVVISIKMWKI